jgi:hypothetical protein
LAVVQSEKLAFVANGENFETTPAEAVLISPKVYESLQIDPSIRTFAICDLDPERDQGVDSDFLKTFLQCVHSHEFVNLSQRPNCFQVW